MANSITWSLEGADDVVSKFKEIDFDIRRRGGRASLRRAAEVVQNAARAAAQDVDDPDTAEKIAANVAVRWNGRLFKASGNLGFRVGVLGGARQYGDTRENRRKRRVGATYATGGSSANPGGDTWYWRLVEFGVPAHGIDGTEFMQDALRLSAPAATDKFLTEYGKSLDRAIRRARKAAGVAK